MFTLPTVVPVYISPDRRHTTCFMKCPNRTVTKVALSTWNDASVRCGPASDWRLESCKYLTIFSCLSPHALAHVILKDTIATTVLHLKKSETEDICSAIRVIESVISSPKMRTPVALLPCLVAMCWAAAPKKCPKSELAEIEYSVRTCQKQAEARFFISPDSLRLCQLLVEASSYR